MSDEFTNRIVGKLGIEHQDAHAVAKNAATNGRLFAVMLFVANLAAFIDGRGRLHWQLALYAASIVGLSYLADAVPTSDTKKRINAVLIAVFATAVFVWSIIL